MDFIQPNLTYENYLKYPQAPISGEEDQQNRAAEHNRAPEQTADWVTLLTQHPETIPRHRLTVTMFVTPQIADVWMGFNCRNRLLSNTKIKEYFQAMDLKAWHETGEPLKFDWNGELIDGQHRLIALQRIKVGQWFDVRFGLDPEVKKYIDTGRKRTFGDILGMLGEKNANELAASLGAIQAYNTRKFSYIGSPCSHELGLLILDAHPRVRMSLEPGLALYKILRPKLAIAFHYLCSNKDQEKAAAFFSGLAIGNNLDGGSPILMLRERLSNERRDRKSQTKAIELAALVVKAWNAYSTGRTIKRLVWSSHGATIEPFPLLNGDTYTEEPLPKRQQKKPISPQDEMSLKDRVLSLRTKGHSIRQIAIMLEITPSKVFRYITEVGNMQ